MSLYRPDRIPRSLADAAWLDIREQILSCTLAPGEAISIKDQAERLGMSIMPIREAIKRLKSEGLVSQESQRGSFVTPISVERMNDIYAVRIAVEGLAVRLACEHIKESDYHRLSEILDQFENAYEHKNDREGSEFHRQFHLELYAIAGSETLNRIIPPLVDDSGRYRALSAQTRGTPQERRVEHQRILDACMARDADRAVSELNDHLGRTITLVKESTDPGR